MQLLHLLPRFLRRHKCIEILCKLGLQERTLEINFNNGSKAVVDLADPEPRNVFIKSEFETHFFDIAKAFLPADGIFFDLGSNIGFCTFGLCFDRPEASYHLFEANPQLIGLLKRSIELHPLQKFVLNHACISDRVGTTRFQLEPNQSGQSHVSTQDDSGLVVSNLTLDDYCEAQLANSVDFAKIDLEGHELPALRVGESTLLNTESRRSTSKSCLKIRLGMEDPRMLPRFPRIAWLRTLSVQGR